MNFDSDEGGGAPLPRRLLRAPRPLTAGRPRNAPDISNTQGHPHRHPPDLRAHAVGPGRWPCGAVSDSTSIHSNESGRLGRCALLRAVTADLHNTLRLVHFVHRPRKQPVSRNRHFALVHFLHHRSDVAQRPFQHFVRRTVRLRNQPRKLLQFKLGVVQKRQHPFQILFIQQIRHVRRYQPGLGTVESRDKHEHPTRPATPAPVRPHRSAASPDRCPCRGDPANHGQPIESNPADSPPPRCFEP